VSWISEKDAVLSSDDFGKDLASVQTLQRKHEGIERDLAALEVSSRLIADEADLNITGNKNISFAGS
jgi:spectrin alpha